MFSGCVPGAACDTERFADACTRIGMSRECGSNVDAGYGLPVASSNPHRFRALDGAGPEPFRFRPRQLLALT